MEPVTLSRGLKVAAAVFGALMIGLLALNNVQIGAQLAVVEQQRDFQAKADPLVRDGRRLATDLLGQQDTARRRAREAALLVRAATPLVAELSDTAPPVAEAARRTPAFMAAVMDVLRESRAIQRETLAIQRETRELQRQSLAIQRETLAIQKEALAHVRSIDRKTGGTAPAAPVLP